MVANGTNGLTPTQRRIHAALRDGEPHGLRELFTLLDDPPGETGATPLALSTAWKTLQVHVNGLRKYIRPRRDIVCQLIHRRKNYRMVRVLCPAE